MKEQIQYVKSRNMFYKSTIFTLHVKKGIVMISKKIYSLNNLKFLVKENQSLLKLMEHVLLAEKSRQT